MVLRDVISRREFLSVSAIGTLGSLTQSIPSSAEGAPDPATSLTAQTPSPTPTPTPIPVPDKPGKPSLVSDDLLARGPDFLAVFWGTVAGAASYELKVVSSLGSFTQAYPTETARVEGLSS